LIAQGLHPVAVVLLPGAWLVYAALFAGIGLAYSLGSRTSLRATIWTLLTVLGVSLGHWLLSSLCCFVPLRTVADVPGKDVEFLMKIEFGQTPPAVLAWLAIHGQEFEEAYSSQEAWELTLSSLFGLLCWAAAAAVLWKVTSDQFRRMTGRRAVPGRGAARLQARPVQSDGRKPAPR